MMKGWRCKSSEYTGSITAWAPQCTGRRAWKSSTTHSLVSGAASVRLMAAHLPSGPLNWFCWLHQRAESFCSPGTPAERSHLDMEMKLNWPEARHDISFIYYTLIRLHCFSMVWKSWFHRYQCKNNFILKAPAATLCTYLWIMFRMQFFFFWGSTDKNVLPFVRRPVILKPQSTF